MPRGMEDTGSVKQSLSAKACPLPDLIAETGAVEPQSSSRHPIGSQPSKSGQELPNAQATHDEAEEAERPPARKRRVSNQGVRRQSDGAATSAAATLDGGGPEAGGGLSSEVAAKLAGLQEFFSTNGLPFEEGWRVRIAVRSNGERDVYYHPPGGRRCRSMAEVARAFGVDAPTVSRAGGRPAKLSAVAPPPDEETGRLADRIRANNEPYLQGPWRRQPWPVRQYESLPGYRPAADCGTACDGDTLLRKLHAAPPAGTASGSRPSDDDMIRSVAAALLAHRRARAAGAPEAPVALHSALAPLAVGADIEERPSWGMDRFTRRAVSDALALCPEVCPPDMDAAASLAARDAFIEQELLPAVNAQGEHGWDILRALSWLQQHRAGQPAAAAAEHLVRLLTKVEAYLLAQTGPGPGGRPAANGRGDAPAGSIPGCEHFRIHPKGQGVFCARQGGLPAGTFVAEYLGELYPAWRWFEKQDAHKKASDGKLPDFYNIALERPSSDPAGYDILFVEGADAGNAASRLCHSCGPNCETVPAVLCGRITNAVFTLRHISQGEELSWDYACVTESEREVHEAVCLCGAAACRGSFLALVSAGAFQEVMSERHGFLERCAALLHACCSGAPTPEDQEVLARNGIGTSILRKHPDSEEPPPDWMVRWASLVVRYIEDERRLLPAILQAAPGECSSGRRQRAALPPAPGSCRHGSAAHLQPPYAPGAGSARDSAEAAEIEAGGVRSQRLQSLAVSLDRAKLFLRGQPPRTQRMPPLAELPAAAVLEHLWSGEHSVAGRAAAVLAGYIGWAELPPDEAAAVQAACALLDTSRPADAAAARAALRAAAVALRRAGPKHAGLHDLLHLTAATQCFFKPAPYIAFSSQGRGGQAPGSAPGPAEGADPLDSPCDSKASRRRSAGAARPPPIGDGKAYRSFYCWGQLVGWFKQTVADPTASLAADARGCLRLPDLESVYGGQFVSGSYLRRERPALLEALRRAPGSAWRDRKPGLWTFKTPTKVFGSPMFDAALHTLRGAPDPAPLAALLAELESAFA